MSNISKEKLIEKAIENIDFGTLEVVCETLNKKNVDGGKISKRDLMLEANNLAEQVIEEESMEGESYNFIVKHDKGVEENGEEIIQPFLQIIFAPYEVIIDNNDNQYGENDEYVNVLKSELQNVLEEEDYERAKEIQDEINKYENKDK